MKKNFFNIASRAVAIACVLAVLAGCSGKDENGGNTQAPAVNNGSGGEAENTSTPTIEPTPTAGTVVENPVDDDSENSEPETFPVVRTTSKNPIITSIYTADPSARVWDDGRVYIYASHDTDPPQGCDLMDRYHVFSSSDMVNWVDEGEILASSDVEWGREEGGFMWAPDCVYKDGTYYFYYPHPSGSDWNATWKIGVATSKHPSKDFVDQGYIEGAGGFSMIDPNVFIDDDGTAYLYYGGGGKCVAVELGDDMMTINGDTVTMVGLEDFHEASWVFKRDGVYYMTYADNTGGNNQMRYAMSDSPLGPWDSKGIFLKSTGCDTTHGSVAEFQGEWYLFYHNQTISFQGNLRSVCVDKLFFNDDGTMQVVNQTRLGGVPLVGEPDVPAFESVIYDVADCELAGGVELRDKDGDGNDKVAVNFHLEGASCTFTNIDGGNGRRATIGIVYTTGEQMAKLNLTVNGKDYSLLNCQTTKSWSDYKGYTSITVKLEAGMNSVMISNGYGGISVDYITVTPIE